MAQHMLTAETEVTAHDPGMVDMTHRASTRGVDDDEGVWAA